MMQAQWRADTQSGTSLTFENCKGGYFSSKDEYGLRVIGKATQNASPSPLSPVAIRCVKAGSKILCGNEITVPCDLYEGDIWFPMTGTVERHFSHEKLDPSRDSGAYTYNRLNGVYLRRQYHELSDARVTGLCTHESRVGKYYDAAGTYMWIMDTEGLYWIGILDHLNMTIEAFRAWFENEQTSDHPIMIAYPLKTPTIEQFEPQPIWAPTGEIHVAQTPTDLSADLSATMLVRR